MTRTDIILELETIIADSNTCYGIPTFEAAIKLLLQDKEYTNTLEKRLKMFNHEAGCLSRQRKEMNKKD